MNYYITVSTSDARLSARQSVLVTAGTDHYLCTVIKVMNCTVPRFGRFVKIVDISGLTLTNDPVDLGTFIAQPISMSAQQDD